MLKDRLVYLRKEKKKTQEQIAKVIGVTRPAYTAYEKGTRTPDYEILITLADYYDVSIDYLLERTDNPEPIDRKEEKAFFDAVTDPELKIWWQELPESSEEELKALREMWEILKRNKKI